MADAVHNLEMVALEVEDISVNLENSEPLNSSLLTESPKPTPSTKSSTSESETPSLLDRLRSPTPSDLSRKRTAH